MNQTYEYIYAVYQYGSIKAAAEKLNVTQPAISIAIKKAEETFGSPLFNRNDHPFTLTDAGQITLQRITEIKHLEDSMLTELQDLKHLKTGTLRIASTSYFSNTLLPRLLQQYISAFPDIRISVEEMGSEKILGSVIAGDTDLALYPIDESAEIDQIPVYQDPLLFAIPNHFLPEDTINRDELVFLNYNRLNFIPTLRSLDLFNRIPFIMLKNHSWFYNQLTKIFEAENISSNPCLYVDQVTTAHRLACSGFAATLTTMDLAKESASQAGNILERITFFRYPSPHMNRVVCITTKKGAYLSNAARAFLDIAKDYRL